MLCREEREVVDAMVDLLVENCGSTGVIELGEFSHLFGVACYSSKFIPDDESYKRIRAEVSWRISELARTAGQIAKATKRRR